MQSIEELDDVLGRPSPGLTADLARTKGDIIVLGAAGKLGPSLIRLALNAIGSGRTIHAVSRFSDPKLAETLGAFGANIVRADVADETALRNLPDAPNIIYLVGAKFGSTGNEPDTWFTNAYLPGRIAERYSKSRIVVLSTGNIYPLVDVRHQGALETTAPGPRGEYAQSCLGRERIFEYFSSVHGTPGRLFRLNYAIDLRYGVLFDLASRVKAGTPIDLSLMGHVNVIWQGDANAQALRTLLHCTSPTTPINVSGPETLSVRWLVQELAARLEVKPNLIGEEAPTAWLTNSAQATKLFGYPSVPLAAMLDWVADWVARDGVSYNKPTKYEVRDGDF